MLMPACSGMKSVLSELPLSEAKAARRVGGGVDADAEPRDAVAAEDAENRTRQDHEHRAEGFFLQTFEIINHADRDENPERGEKFSLLEQIGFAGFPDDVGNVAHGFVDWQRARLFVLQQAEQRMPIAQMIKPEYKIACAPRPPPKNETSCNDGRLMSASPAKAFVAQNSRGRKNCAAKKCFVSSHKERAACRSRV